MKYKRIIALALAMAVFGSASAVSAKEYKLESKERVEIEVGDNGTTSKSDNGKHAGWLKQGRIPGLRSVVGTVTAVGSSTVTIAGEDGKTYSVDTSSAKAVGSDNSTTSLSSLEVGDQVLVKGTIVGTSSATTSVNAKLIFQDIGEFFKKIGERISQLFERMDRDNRNEG